MTKPTRRDFLKAASTSAAVAMTAASYSRIAGANDRIRIAIIGCGNRGTAHAAEVRPFAQEQNVEIAAVCDPWRVHREQLAAKIKEWYDYADGPEQHVSYRDIITRNDIDAVMIASCDHQHIAHLEAAAREKKDAYCEKPMGTDFEKVKAACDAVKESGIVVQIGTQLRSMPSFTGVRELIRSGALGPISRIEQCRNGGQPYWYDRLRDVKEEDADWAEFLMDQPMRPFNPAQYSGWYGYRGFSDGPVPQLGSHFIDLVHYITDCGFPASCVSMGGTYTWKDEYKFTSPDQAQAMWEYPEGFFVSYSTNFGNSDGNSFKLFAENGVVDMLSWKEPKVSGSGVRKGAKSVGDERAVEHVEMPDHFLDWLQCLRTRKAPNAPIEAGYQHAVAVLMAVRSMDTGKRMIYDREKRLIVEG